MTCHSRRTAIRHYSPVEPSRRDGQPTSRYLHRLRQLVCCSSSVACSLTTGLCPPADQGTRGMTCPAAQLTSSICTHARARARAHMRCRRCRNARSTQPAPGGRGPRARTVSLGRRALAAALADRTRATSVANIVDRPGPSYRRAKQASSKPFGADCSCSQIRLQVQPQYTSE